MVCADRRSLRLLLIVAVTILLSVLPFKAPSVKPIVMSNGPAEYTLLAEMGPLLRDAGDLADEEVAETPGSLKVAKKSNRNVWGADHDLSSENPLAIHWVKSPKTGHAHARDRLGTRSPPCQRLRAPPGNGDYA